MKVRFKCKCGVRLRCSLRGIGQVLPCPGCSDKVAVPVPGLTEVHRALKEIPHAMPNKSTTEYLHLTLKIRANSEFNVHLCGITGHRSLAADCVDQAKRMLRNIAVFLNDAAPVSVIQDRTPTTSVVQSLAYAARGQDFGGSSTAKWTLQNHRSSHETQSNRQLDRDHEVYPLRDQVFATIKAIESLIPTG